MKKFNVEFKLIKRGVEHKCFLVMEATDKHIAAVEVLKIHPYDAEILSVVEITEV